MGTAMLSPVLVTLLVSAVLSPPATPGPEAKSAMRGVIPVRIGVYATVSTGCATVIASFIHIESNGFGVNKTTGKDRHVACKVDIFTLDVLWVEAGATEAEGDTDTVTIRIEDPTHFVFSNALSTPARMMLCR